MQKRSTEEKREAVLFMWEMGLSQAMARYKVTSTCLYKWRNQLIDQGVIQDDTTDKVVRVIQERTGASAGDILAVELDENDHSPVAYMNESLKTRMLALKAVNRILPKTKSLKEVAMILKVINDGIKDLSVAKPLSGLPATTMWEATEQLLKNRDEIKKIEQGTEDINHEEIK